LLLDFSPSRLLGWQPIDEEWYLDEAGAIMTIDANEGVGGRGDRVMG
jgi:hypothetical protein